MEMAKPSALHFPLSALRFLAVPNSRSPLAPAPDNRSHPPNPVHRLQTRASTAPNPLSRRRNLGIDFREPAGDAPCTPRDASCTPRDASCAPRYAPRTPRDAPRTPRDAPRAPRDAPHALRDAPHALRDAPHVPRDSPNTPRDSPNTPREAPRAPLGAPLCSAIFLDTRSPSPARRFPPHKHTDQ
jgi:hypothetical protein